MRPTALRGLALVLTFATVVLADGTSTPPEPVPPTAQPASPHLEFIDIDKMQFLSKFGIEKPVERTLVERSDLRAAGAPPTSASADAGNPKTRPGLVHWHSDLDEALAASKLSGKPVLVFQLMGLLDDEFC